MIREDPTLDHIILGLSSGLQVDGLVQVEQLWEVL